MLSAAVFIAGLATVFASGYGSRCYDCNYAPSGYTKQVNYWTRVSSNAGYAGCALSKYGDAETLDKWSCASGECFIRKDPNGLVYRGCANKENLPLGVSTYKQCANQAGSLWYFCKGDLCNSKQLGDYGVCGYKPSYHASYPSPCDGKCYNNPSGLFADKYNKNGFIQCGCDYKYGKACICCKPFFMKCPYGTAFDDSTKVCSKAAYSAPAYKAPKPAYKAPKQAYKAPEPEYKAHEPVYHAPAYGYQAPSYGYNQYNNHY
ncbi:unnamed protein product [Owenia fusiformis]|uniref:Uncharacterized protein n=1 Tax=Owenia fusiformis TaxID=6347 RepID=A0A8J1Y070_OWEFU|nr:unnamed protein product [Owenia fusiformis]